MASVNLVPSELFRYEWRVEVFLRKYKKGESFTLMNGVKRKMVYSSQLAKMIKNEEIASLQGKVLLGNDQKLYKLGDLKISDEFLLNPKGFYVKKEKGELQSLNEQIESYKTKRGSACISLKIGNDIYDVALAQDTFGTPKSDFHFIDNRGKEVVWISHKHGRLARDFQQWGGMTDTGIVEEKEIKNFVEAVRAMFPKGMVPATTVARKIKSKTLRMKAIYGTNFGGPFGKNNVTLVMQGPIEIKERGKYFQICTNHVHNNGEDIVGNDYEPVLAAVYKGDRSTFGIQGARFSILPIGGRLIHDWI